MMKKIVGVALISVLLMLFSCENGQFVGDWQMDSAVFHNTPYSIPTQLTMRSDYTYNANGPFISWAPQSTYGYYSLQLDSIFFGPDSLQKFKVVGITSTNFIIQRYYDDSCDFNLTIWYTKQ